MRLTKQLLHGCDTKQFLFVRGKTSSFDSLLAPYFLEALDFQPYVQHEICQPEQLEPLQGSVQVFALLAIFIFCCLESDVNCCASRFTASLIAAAAFLSSSMVIAISYIFDIYCSSFLGLSVCGDDTEILRHSCGYMAYCSESCNHFCVSIASVVKGLINCVHLAFCRSLCFALHYSMEVRWSFGRKVIKSFLKRKIVP